MDGRRPSTAGQLAALPAVLEVVLPESEPFEDDELDDDGDADEADDDSVEDFEP